jgi:nucleoside-diphosphate-sugar epimerase
MLSGNTLLVTGATGQVAFPIVRALAPHNRVLAFGRFQKAEDRARVAALGAEVVQGAADLTAIIFIQRKRRRFRERQSRISAAMRQAILRFSDRRAAFGIARTVRTADFRRFSSASAKTRSLPAITTATGKPI